MYTSSLLTHDYAVGYRKDGEYKKCQHEEKNEAKKKNHQFDRSSFSFRHLSTFHSFLLFFMCIHFFCASFIPVDISNVFSIFLSFSRTYTYILFFTFYLLLSIIIVIIISSTQAARKERKKICGIWRS